MDLTEAQVGEHPIIRIPARMRVAPRLLPPTVADRLDKRTTRIPARMGQPDRGPTLTHRGAVLSSPRMVKLRTHSTTAMHGERWEQQRARTAAKLLRDQALTAVDTPGKPATAICTPAMTATFTRILGVVGRNTTTAAGMMSISRRAVRGPFLKRPVARTRPHLREVSNARVPAVIKR